jgi:hypothetical protein
VPHLIEHVAQQRAVRDRQQRLGAATPPHARRPSLRERAQALPRPARLEAPPRHRASELTPPPPPARAQSCGKERSEGRRAASSPPPSWVMRGERGARGAGGAHHHHSLEGRAETRAGGHRARPVLFLHRHPRSACAPLGRWTGWLLLPSSRQGLHHGSWLPPAAALRRLTGGVLPLLGTRDTLLFYSFKAVRTST